MCGQTAEDRKEATGIVDGPTILCNDRQSAAGIPGKPTAAARGALFGLFLLACVAIDLAVAQAQALSPLMRRTLVGLTLGQAALAAIWLTAMWPRAAIRWTGYALAILALSLPLLSLPTIEGKDAIGLLLLQSALICAPLTIARLFGWRLNLCHACDVREERRLPTNRRTFAVGDLLLLTTLACVALAALRSLSLPGPTAALVGQCAMFAVIALATAFAVLGKRGTILGMLFVLLASSYAAASAVYDLKFIPAALAPVLATESLTVAAGSSVMRVAGFKWSRELATN